MVLRANKYPDVWVFSNECPSPSKDCGWVSSKVKVKEFVDFFLLPQFFGRIIVWEHKSWFTDNYSSEKTINGFCVLNYPQEAELVRFAIESYSETGHLSVLFVPRSPDIFLEKILQQGHYGKPEEILVGTKKPDDPLDWQYGRDITFLKSSAFNNGERIFTFSHDAEYLYEILR